MFFEKILEISKADISGISGYGEFDDDCKPQYATCREFLADTLRWHTSIDDTVSYDSIVKSLSELEDRIMAL